MNTTSPRAFAVKKSADRPPSKPLQTRLENEAPTVDRGEGNVDSIVHTLLKVLMGVRWRLGRHSSLQPRALLARGTYRCIHIKSY